MSTIQTDVADTNDGILSQDDAADAFLTSFNVEPDEDEDADAKKRKPSEEVEDTDNAEDEGAEDEASDESPEADAEGDKDKAPEKAADKKYVDSDETYVKVKVGDTEQEVSVKDLKRLFGQEASLTQKSQEVANQRKIADTQAATNVAALNVLLERAKAKAAPYETLDWLAIAKNPDISAEEASALRLEAQAALADKDFLEKDLGSLMSSITQKNKDDTVVAAKACVQALSTPGTKDKPNPLHIEGWNDKAYDDLRKFATDLGADSNSINSMTDPVAFKVLHMAMQFKKGASKVLTVKTNKTPTKIVKTSSSTSAVKTTQQPHGRKAAMARLRASGSQDDAADAFLAGMADSE